MATLFRTWTAGAIADVASPSNWNPANGYPPIQTPGAPGVPAVYRGLTGILVCMVGATTDRLGTIPNDVTNLRVQGQRFFDTTLGKLLIHDGYFWRDPATGLAA